MGEFSFDSLIGSIREVDSQFVSSAAKAVNVSLTMRNWCVGAYIAEYATAGLSHEVFVSNYEVGLPKVKDVEEFLAGEMQVLR